MSQKIKSLFFAINVARQLILIIFQTTCLRTFRYHKNFNEEMLFYKTLKFVGNH